MVGPVIAVVGYGLFMIPNVGGSYGINYLSRPEGAAEAVRAIESAGSRAQAFQADVAQVAEIRRLFAGVAAAFGGIDIVVANAGMPFIGVPVIDVTEEDFDRVYGVNNKGSFFVMQEAARRVRHGGRIVDISSSTTFFTAAGMGVHAASKAGSKLIVEVLAAELGSKRITVNSVMPGATRTEFILNKRDSNAPTPAPSPSGSRLARPPISTPLSPSLILDGVYSAHRGRTGVPRRAPPHRRRAAGLTPPGHKSTAPSTRAAIRPTPNDLLPNRSPIQPGPAPEPTLPLGLHSPKTPKCAETWCLEPINGPEILRFWTEISRD